MNTGGIHFVQPGTGDETVADVLATIPDQDRDDEIRSVLANVSTRD